VSDSDPDFVCMDCGARVYRFPRHAPLPEPLRCCTCEWLAEFVPSPAEQAHIRATLAGATRPPPFTCPLCQRASWHPDDAKHRYCGVCGFVDDPVDKQGRLRP
jgi:Zn ribbon nucleic-acid-binding protein